MGISTKTLNTVETITKPVSGYHLGDHLSHPPGIIIHRGKHRPHRFIVPRVKQAAGRPDPEPVRRAFPFPSDCPARWRPAQGNDQFGVRLAAFQQCDTPRDDCSLASSLALFLYSLAGRWARGGQAHLSSMSLGPYKQ
jgi:hypothetical protein